MVSKSKLTPKQHKFAELVAADNTLSDAYLGAYAAANMKPQSIRNEASTLMMNPYVTSMVDRLRARIEAVTVRTTVSTRDKVLERLDKLSLEGLPSDSVKVSATVWLGKTCGMFRDFVETTVQRSPDEIRRELEERLRMLGDETEEAVH